MNKNHIFLMLAAAYVLDPKAVYRKMVKVDRKTPINPAVLFNLQQNRDTYRNNRGLPMRPENMDSPVRRQYFIQRTV